MHMHNYLNMLCACYRDIASAYPAQYVFDHAKDIDLINRRFKQEGIAFLTKTLPAYAKAIDLALATGTELSVPFFGKKKGTAYPRFLGWLVALVFDADGREREDSLPRALVHLRQLLYLFYKLEVPYDEQSINRVLHDFVTTDESLGRGIHISDHRHKRVLMYASNLVRRVLGGVCPKDIVPKHGPGSVATSEKPWQKPYFSRDYTNATNYYPLDSHYYFNSAHLSMCLEDGELKVRDLEGRLRSWKTMAHSTAKVVLVPKDSRGPRLISMEPLEIQWLQQGQCELLVRSLESHWLTKGHVNFTNQDVNRYLAWYSSWFSLDRPESWDPTWKGIKTPIKCAKPESQDLVTLDMKEASDRVSVAHIANLFPDNWVEALMSTRSSHTELPDGSVIELNKFAPMGSAVCFPVEALVFWALSLAAIRCTNPEFACLNEGKPLLEKLRTRVWVYGDDLVIHREDYARVTEHLELTGLLLNANKCCVAGSFRESCGFDAYKGVDVTPLRIKECIGNHWTGQSLMSYVSYSNEAYRRGYTELAYVIEKTICDVVKIPFTTVDRGNIQFVRPDANVRALNKLHKVRTRFCKRWHFLQAYGPTPRAVVSKGHNVTQESYLSRYLLTNRLNPDDITPPTWDSPYDNSSEGGSPGLKADQYSVPRRVTSNRGWKQVTL